MPSEVKLLYLRNRRSPKLKHQKKSKVRMSPLNVTSLLQAQSFQSAFDKEAILALEYIFVIVLLSFHHSVFSLAQVEGLFPFTSSRASRRNPNEFPQLGAFLEILFLSIVPLRSSFTLLAVVRLKEFGFFCPSQ